MATTEGSVGTGWLILFSTDETRVIAQGVSDYGDPIAAVCGLIPEPYITNAIAVGTKVLTIAAKQAVKKERALGLYARGFTPFRRYKLAGRLLLNPSDVPQKLYALSTASRIISPPFTPFLYRENDPQGLEVWRSAFGM